MMAEKKAEAASPAASAKPKKQVIMAGGHVIEADPVAPTPKEVVPCSVCSAQVDSKGMCPNGHGAGGWNVGGAS